MQIISHNHNCYNLILIIKRELDATTIDPMYQRTNVYPIGISKRKIRGEKERDPDGKKLLSNPNFLISFLISVQEYKGSRWAINTT